MVRWSVAALAALWLLTPHATDDRLAIYESNGVPITEPVRRAPRDTRVRREAVWPCFTKSCEAKPIRIDFTPPPIPPLRATA